MTMTTATATTAPPPSQGNSMDNDAYIPDAGSSVTSHKNTPHASTNTTTTTTTTATTTQPQDSPLYQYLTATKSSHNHSVHTLSMNAYNHLLALRKRTPPAMTFSQFLSQYVLEDVILPYLNRELLPNHILPNLPGYLGSEEHLMAKGNDTLMGEAQNGSEMTHMISSFDLEEPDELALYELQEALCDCFEQFQQCVNKTIKILKVFCKHARTTSTQSPNSLESLSQWSNSKRFLIKKCLMQAFAQEIYDFDDVALYIETYIIQEANGSDGELPSYCEDVLNLLWQIERTEGSVEFEIATMSVFEDMTENALKKGIIPPDYEPEDLDQNSTPVGRFTTASAYASSVTRVPSRSSSITTRYTSFRSTLDINDTTSVKNLKFYSGEAPNEVYKLHFDDFIQKVKGDFSFLESAHNYIQFMFPNREKGLYGAQPISKYEAEQFVKSPVIQKNVITAYKTILEFYGVELVDDKTGAVCRLESIFRDRYANMHSHTHNNLRMTRILKFLGIVGFEHFKKPLILHWIREIFGNRLILNAASACVEYWIPTLRHESHLLEAEALVFKLTGKYVPRSRYDKEDASWACQRVSLEEEEKQKTEQESLKDGSNGTVASNSEEATSSTAGSEEQKTLSQQSRTSTISFLSKQPEYPEGAESLSVFQWKKELKPIGSDTQRSTVLTRSQSQREATRKRSLSEEGSTIFTSDEEVPLPRGQQLTYKSPKSEKQRKRKRRRLM